MDPVTQKTSSHPVAVTDLTRTYEQEIGRVDNKSWSDYWYNMAQDGTWVDHIFIQMVAWYMELDLLILTTSSQPENPFIFISGNIDNILAPDSIPPLLLGNYTNVHYQSLLLAHREMTQGNEQESNGNTVSQEQKHEGQGAAALQLLWHVASLAAP